MVGIRVASIIVINNFTVESALTPLYVDYPPLAEFATTVRMRHCSVVRYMARFPTAIQPIWMEARQLEI